MTYNLQGKRITSENLAGQVTTTAWDCCHKVSETQPDGSTTTWDYDAEGRMIASSRLIPLDMTNVTWLTTCYRYDDLGRQVATWQTNYAAQVGLPVTRTRYDQLGRVIARIDALGNTTSTSYSPDGRTVFVHNPNTSTRITTRSASGDTLSITGTAVTPEFHSYGILPDGTRWSRTVQGETANSPRFTKRYENLLAQTVREERSGFKGSVLATTHVYDSHGRLVSTSADYEPCTEYTYDVLGNREATTKTVGGDDLGAPQSADTQWRKTETLSSFVLSDAIVWLTQTNIVSCSDSAIAPLFTSSARQLTGLTAALPARSRSYDVRGNVSVNEMLVDASVVTSRQTVPYATNKPLAISRYGVSLMDVSVSAVTNSVAYDALGRQIANTDGRGNTRHVEYNSFGQRSASIDALGNRTTYSYDQFGNLASVTDSLGHTIVYEYDLCVRMIYEGGATYPVRYTYDIFGNKTTMTTFRDAGGPGFVPAVGDTTTWLYDEASNCMTNKVYADGKGPTYSYTPDGKQSCRIWARDVVTTYSYDGWNNLNNTEYSDGTPTVSIVYDAMGRRVFTVDATGLTATTYGDYGEVQFEAVSGLYSRVASLLYDEYGRYIGYSIGDVRQSVVEYARDSGRVKRASFANEWNVYSYLPRTDLKSALSFGCTGRTDWTYEKGRDLLSEVKNTALGNVVSLYNYVNDRAGRRVVIGRSGTMMSETRTDYYGYNERNELTNAVKNAMVVEHAYKYDDMGNRIASVDCGANSIYSANKLNQYASISSFAVNASFAEEFAPQFDDDGNQTLIKTSTGVWHVLYNGENRPVNWSNGMTNITMKFDRMGRRVEYVETAGANTNAHCRFVYHGYLCVQRLDATNGNATELSFGWDPTEPVATRPLWMQSEVGSSNYFYFHDGNKNVSDLVSHKSGQGVVAHYEYNPFGAVLTAGGGVTLTSDDLALCNPYRFSSEYSDNATGLVYYNYRHYEPVTGRWISRDPQPRPMSSLYAMAVNNPVGAFDWLGLDPDPKTICEEGLRSAESRDQVKDITRRMNNRQCSFTAKCECCNVPGRFGELTPETARSSTLTLCIDGPNKTAKDFEETYIHELIHAEDHCGYNSREFTCDQKICSELKAYSEDGSCRDGGSYRLPGETERECIERGALTSTFKRGHCENKSKDELKKEISSKYLYCVSSKVKTRIREESKMKKKNQRGN